ncbi:MAG: type I-B CRISPR-associated protein Cas7/Cst2/DevR [Thermodesulfobacteriota bacterium]|nr:type I-B CRISPR-associated protein Cas7/Cst2/DevR [Thermodesulfobacteriota bacterium]
MSETTKKQEPEASKGLAITYLVRFGIASPSGGRSEIENLNVIKKIREDFWDFPYASAQAMKRALRDTLKGLGYETSPVVNTAPARTVGDPVRYIDDDLFGFMEAGSKKSERDEVDRLNGIRKAVVSMTPLLSLSAFNDNVDFGANMMGLQAGGNPMPYETEVHRGWYRISLYIELDRIGTDAGFITDLKEITRAGDVIDLLKKPPEQYDFISPVLENKQKKLKKGFAIFKRIYGDELPTNKRYCRVKALLDAIRFLAPSGRSSNWLIDLTPKLMIAAYVKGARTPFLETPLIEHAKEGDEKDKINIANILHVKKTFDEGIKEIVVGYRTDLLQKPNMKDDIVVQEMRDAFNTIDGWLKKYFNIKNDK